MTLQAAFALLGSHALKLPELHALLTNCRARAPYASLTGTPWPFSFSKAHHVSDAGIRCVGIPFLQHSCDTVCRWIASPAAAAHLARHPPILHGLKAGWALQYLRAIRALLQQPSRASPPLFRSQDPLRRSTGGDGEPRPRKGRWPAGHDQERHSGKQARPGLDAEQSHRGLHQPEPQQVCTPCISALSPIVCLLPPPPARP